VRRLLLDTRVFLWWLAESPRLGVAARGLVEDGANDVFVSAATGWEIAIKRALGKLEAPESLGEAIGAEGFEHLPISFAHGERAGALPPYHRDPFDRLLIAQAQSESLEIVTANQHIPRYAVTCLSADT